MQAWRLGLGFPIGSAIIAALGFVLAAMWIDTIATELVSMLEYLGLLSGISHTVRPLHLFSLLLVLPSSCAGCSLCIAWFSGSALRCSSQF